MRLTLKSDHSAQAIVGGASFFAANAFGEITANLRQYLEAPPWRRCRLLWTHAMSSVPTAGTKWRCQYSTDDGATWATLCDSTPTTSGTTHQDNGAWTEMPALWPVTGDVLLRVGVFLPVGGSGFAFNLYNVVVEFVS